MPAVLADCEGEACVLVFPRRDAEAPGGWVWDEVAVTTSAIDGHGLAAVHSGSLDWDALASPVFIPLIGRETEVRTAMEAEMCARVLKGDFATLCFAQLAKGQTDGDQPWVTDGLWVERCDREESQACAEGERWVPAAHEMVLQLGARDDAHVYLLASGATELLHIPPHVFTVLCAHQRHHHAERHFASHVAGFRRTHASHMLINAHPAFGEAAYAAGCINEPMDGTRPSMEMRAAKLRVRSRRAQADPFAYAAWLDFAEEFEEVGDKLIYFVTTNEKVCRSQASPSPLSSPLTISLCALFGSTLTARSSPHATAPSTTAPTPLPTSARRRRRACLRTHLTRRTCGMPRGRRACLAGGIQRCSPSTDQHSNGPRRRRPWRRRRWRRR